MIDKIDVSTITDEKRYLDLSVGYAKEVTLTGSYKGDRIVISGASNKILKPENCVIECTRKDSDKDAIVFADAVENLSIWGDGFELIYGGLTFWQQLDNVFISGVDIYYPNAGIKASQNFTNTNVKIEKCTIVGAQREGIYFGPHTKQRNASNGLIIAYNTIRFSGWDAIQFNAINAQVYGNIIDNPAVLEKKDQWFGILAQKGSMGYVYENNFINVKRPRGFLDATIFDYKKEL